MIALGIETSCDDTGVAIVCNNEDYSKRIISNIINSQNEIHKDYGGIVPEYAARAHMARIDKCIERALLEANLTFNDLDIISATACPGLIGSILVGYLTGKTLASLSQKPFYAVNHLEGHLLTARLCQEVSFPYLMVLASGGNFYFAEAIELGKYKILGRTLDDAAGESLDKLAKELQLGYPGGPIIEKYALEGDEHRYQFPMPLQRRPGCDVSFSGLKTAAKNLIRSLAPLSDQDKKDIAASYQYILINFIINQTKKALKLCQSHPQNIVLSGGVAANNKLRSAFEALASEHNLNFCAPPPQLSTDNGAMIAWTGIEYHSRFLPCTPFSRFSSPKLR